MSVFCGWAALLFVMRRTYGRRLPLPQRPASGVRLTP